MEHDLKVVAELAEPNGCVVYVEKTYLGKTAEKTARQSQHAGVQIQPHHI